MAYLDIIFHNIQSKHAIVAGGPAQYVAHAPNVCDSPIIPGLPPPAGPGYGGPPASAGWGPNVASGVPDNAFAGVFFCESPGFEYFTNPGLYDIPPTFGLGPWAAHVPPIVVPGLFAVPGLPGTYDWWFVHGLFPFPIHPLTGRALPKLCAFLDSNVAPAIVPTVAPPPPAAGWFGGTGGIHVVGTGRLAPPAPLPLPPITRPPGSDRYAIFFQAGWNYHTGAIGAALGAHGGPVRGIFAHTKNTAADPGTQIAALCRTFPNAIVFGDLNLDLRNPPKLESLRHAVFNTHTVLTLRLPTLVPYETRPGSGSALDYALVPNAHIADVEIWGCRLAGAAPNLWRGGPAGGPPSTRSDHSAMRLRIRVQ